MERRILWALAFGLVAALAAGFGAAIFAVWSDDGRADGFDALQRSLRDARVLVWVAFATGVGFVLAGRDRLTSSVDSLFEEDRRVWVRRVLLERDSASRDPITSGDSPAAVASDLPDLPDLPGLPEADPLPSPPIDASAISPAGLSSPTRPPESLPPLSLDRPPLDDAGIGLPRQPTFARRGPSSRLLTLVGVLAGAGAGAGIGALLGEIAPGTALGVAVGLLVGLLLDRND